MNNNNEIILKVKLQNKEVTFLTRNLSNEELQELNNIKSHNITIEKKENTPVIFDPAEIFPLNFII
jgi:hypothetical protein